MVYVLNKDGQPLMPPNRLMKLYNVNCLDYLKSEQFKKDIGGGASFNSH